MRLRHGSAGFSLIEMLIALSITIGVAAAMLQLFTQGQRVFRDEALLLEARQTTRAVASQIADTIRRAGQGVPIYPARSDVPGSEAVGTFMAGTSADLLRVRVGYQRPDTALNEALPLLFEVGRPVEVRTRDPLERFDPEGHVFLWGESGNSWTWVRARVEGFDPVTGLGLIPTETGPRGGRFTATPRVTGEYALSYRLEEGSVLRGEPLDLSLPGDPRFRESSMGEDFTTLEFVYYDQTGMPLDPATLPARRSIRRVDFLLEAETAQPLGDGRRRTYAVTMSVAPRSMDVR